MNLHIAFEVDLDAVLSSPQTLKQAGIAPLDFDGAPTDEPVVLGWMPAASQSTSMTPMVISWSFYQCFNKTQFRTSVLCLGAHG